MKRWLLILLGLTIFIFLIKTQAQDDTTRSTPPNLPPVEKKEALPKKPAPGIVPDLPTVEKKEVLGPKQVFPKAPDLPEVDKKAVPVKPPSFLTPPELPIPERKGVTVPEEMLLTAPNLPEIEFLQVQEFKDFRGGLNLKSYKTNLQPNQALVLENALWTKEGEIVKRQGYDTLKTTPEVFNFLYRYYQQDGDKYLMGGSDTALYFWEEDSSEWTYLIGTEGTSGRWDGTTFEDMFVGTHEGIMPVAWDGSKFIELGTSVDSFQIISVTSYGANIGCDTAIVRLNFESNKTGWVTNEWVGYVLGYWAEEENYEGTLDTVFLHEYVNTNTGDRIDIRSFGKGKLPIVNTYARLYSWFYVDSIWREGEIDTSIFCMNYLNFWWPISYGAKLTDSSFYWDSTFNYSDYVFEVTGGTGEGIRCFMNDYCPSINCAGAGWDTLGFYLPTFSNCFDNGSSYRIYTISPLAVGSKFVENFDRRLWLAWTGLGKEQNKNRIIYSEVSDLGNFIPENNIWIESDDGDYITGMIQMYSDQGGFRDTPYPELFVSKNNSLYKILPTSTAGLYNTFYIAKGVGCGSNSAMASIEGRYLVFPDQNGVFAYDGNKVWDKPISFLIDPIFEDWDISQIENASAVYNPQDRHYYLSCPEFSYAETSATPWGFLCTFPMDSGSGTVNGSWVHRINSDGDAFGTDLFCNTTTAQGYTDVATDTLGRHIVVWTNNTDDNDVYLTRFNTDDEQVGDSLKIPDGTRIGNVSTGHISADMDNDGHIIVCWTDVQGGDDIWCQFVDWTDGKVDTNFVVNSDWETNTYNCSDVAVSMNTDGIAVVVWTDGRNYSPDTYDIYGQIYDVSDSAIGENFLVKGGTAWTETHPAVAVTGDRFVVSWKNYYSPNHIVQKRAFDIDGTPQEDAVTLTVTSTVDKAYNAIAINDGGNYVVVWDSAGGTWDIWARKFDSSNDPVGVSFAVSASDVNEQYPAVAINNNNIFCVVWKHDAGLGSPDIYYKTYDWSDSLITASILNLAGSNESCSQPEIDCPDAPYMEITTTDYTLAWNIDYQGWSFETFNASAYCYQHSISDSVKVLFADPDTTLVYNYATQADDIDDPVILKYQSPFFNFAPNPSFEGELKYITIESYLDTGKIYIDCYKDYGQLVSQDSVNCGRDCRKEFALPDTVTGKNISMKLTTGSEIDEFVLSRFWWEYKINKCRK